MTSLNKAQQKIEKIEKLLSELKEELSLLASKEGELPAPAKKGAKEPSVPEPELQAEFEKLYQAFEEKNLKEIETFINAKTKVYLKAFCKANSLPVDAKASKAKIYEEVLKWLAQRKAITKQMTL